MEFYFGMYWSIDWHEKSNLIQLGSHAIPDMLASPVLLNLPTLSGVSGKPFYIYIICHSVSSLDYIYLIFIDNFFFGLIQSWAKVPIMFVG